jgi:putative two-component system hydrogenase maturation factor HypX/HoxX
MKILLLASAFNGLTQRAWLELRAAGHEVSVELSVSSQAMREAVELADPDLIICPFLRDRVPADIWQCRRTIIIHPGPPGDRGPSSLDWAVTEAAPRWGVTAL